MKNGAFEPKMAPRKIRSKLCSHSKISPEKKRAKTHYTSVNVRKLCRQAEAKRDGNKNQNRKAAASRWKEIATKTMRIDVW